MSHAANASPKRIAFIDGLRGIAACSVVLFHFNDRLHIGSWPGAIIDHGAYGVALFFVLSGFVITMSLTDQRINARFVGFFALRRSVRLDPPYWCSIALTLFVGVVGARYGVHQTMPSVGTTIAHLFYLQDILGLQPISQIYWSLCLEIQFYLFMVLLLWGLQRADWRLHNVWAHAAMMATIVASLLCRAFAIGHGTFVQLWFCFALGATTFWASNGRSPRRYAAAAIVLVLVVGLFRRDGPAIVVAVSALVIFVADMLNRMDLMGDPVSQFLGRISYSVYLTHSIFGVYSLAIALRYLPRVGAFVVASAVTIGSAWMWYQVIERPSIMLSRRVQSGFRRTAPAPG